jgi:3-methyladenine DNA glycosylase AlkD
LPDLSDRAVRYARRALSDAADPDKAPGMQAYMKTDMPFYGVQMPGRKPILKRLKADYPPADRAEYEDLVLALWDLPHREEKYLAIGVAAAHRAFRTPESLTLFRRLIVEGSWWDLVDAVATDLISGLVLSHPVETWPHIDLWVDDPDMWLRRSALICQVGAKGQTDRERLFDFCLRRADEKEFFIRKAIGWALRDYAWTEPEVVARFALDNREALSGLSFREATKNIRHLIPS